MTEVQLSQQDVSPPAPLKTVLWTLLAVGLWLNFSEIVRYFAVVMPMTREAFPQVPNVAPMNLAVFSSWGIWMVLLTVLTTYLYWLQAAKSGHNTRSVLVAATTGWAFFFVLFWLGTFNMRLAAVDALVIALPWAWVEMAVACWIARLMLERSGL